MLKLVTKRSKKAGLPPGSLVFLGEQRVEKATITIIDYDEAEVREQTLESPRNCREYANSKTVTWINVTGLHDTEVLRELGEALDIHPLILEDVLNTGQRPKFEDYGDRLFCVARMLYRGTNGDAVVSEQVSLLLGANYLLTFQEMEGDVFDLIRNRIRTGKGRIRGMACDYLAYALLDAIVDHHFVILEDVGEKIEDLQEAVLGHPEAQTLEAIHQLKRDLIFMRKNLWPLREMVSNLDRSESALLSKELSPYLRDVYQHTIQVLDNVESSRDGLSSVLDIYMTVVSNRMNEVMKVLTVIATIFIPLTFIAGVYGMNFEHMPELKWPMGYAGVWIVMIATAGVMLVFFKRRKWL